MTQPRRRTEPPPLPASLRRRGASRIEAHEDGASFPPARTDLEMARLIDECTRELCRR